MILVYINYQTLYVLGFSSYFRSMHLKRVHVNPQLIFTVLINVICLQKYMTALTGLAISKRGIMINILHMATCMTANIYIKLVSAILLFL